MRNDTQKKKKKKKPKTKKIVPKIGPTRFKGN